MDYLNALNKMIQDHDLILLYTDHVNKEKFSVGFPIAILNNEWVVLQIIDAHGFLDGYLIKKIDMDIFRYKACIKNIVIHFLLTKKC